MDAITSIAFVADERTSKRETDPNFDAQTATGSFAVRMSGLKVVIFDDGTGSQITGGITNFNTKDLAPEAGVLEPCWTTELVNNIVDIGDMAYKIVQELDNLMEVSFRRPEADSVHAMVDEIGKMEWNADKLQFKIAKMIFSLEEKLSKGDFIVLLEIVRKLGGIADKSEKVGKILRAFITG